MLPKVSTVYRLARGQLFEIRLPPILLRSLQEIDGQNYPEIFIDRIWWQTDNDDGEGNSIVWFEAVVRAAVSSPLVKPAFFESLKKLLLIFHVFIMEPSTQFEDIRRAKLAQFVLVLLSLERIPQLADPTRLETFFTVD